MPRQSSAENEVLSSKLLHLYQGEVQGRSIPWGLEKGLDAIVEV